MARQLVFTSVPQGLTPGRTGYCTVARHRDLRDRLALLIEGLSSYPSDWQPAPVICSYRLLDLAGSSVPVLSRMVSAGQDYSHRAIFLAHHLILDPAEINDAPSPADVFMRWPGWRQRWDEPPAWLEDADLVDLRQLPPAREPALPAQTWECLAGDAGRAALLLDEAKPRAWQLGCDPVGEEYLLALFRESSALLEPAEAWRAEFTTCLPSADSARLYKWAALRLGSPADTASARIGDFLDLTHPESLPLAPDNPATQRARLGHLPPPPVPLPEPTAAVPPIIAPATPVEKTAPPPLVGAKPITASPSTPSAKKSPAPNKLWLIAALAAVLLLGLILLAVYSLRFHFQPPTASPTPHTQLPPLASAAPLPPPAATPRNRILPPPAPTVQPTQPSPLAVSGSNAPRPKSNFSLALPNHAVLDLLWVAPGSFTMGSPDSEPFRNKDEGPQMQVILTQGFWLGKYDVTQEQWTAVMGDNPSDPKHLGFTIPVDTVSWDLAMAFCRLLTQQESAAGRLPAGYEYTLPTEAQWEYACRAGGAPAVSGNEDDLAWYNANSGGTSHRSGLKQPNAWGFFDLHGNIMQWCRDWYATRYTRGSITDPAGPATGTRHVARGGNYASPATDLRDARRFPHPLNYQNNGLGLRLALAPVVK